MLPTVTGNIVGALYHKL